MTPDDKTEARLHDLIAKQAITDAIYRYARGEDRQDAVLSTSLWHADGTATYGYKGELFDGPVADRWAQTTHPSLATYTGSAHQVSNILIHVDGDSAASETYVTARLWRVGDDGEIWQRVTVGRYLDRWSLRDGDWAVDHRRFIFDVSYTVTVPAGAQKDRPWESNPDWFEGRHGTADPSYEILEPLTKRFTR